MSYHAKKCKITLEKVIVINSGYQKKTYRNPRQAANAIADAFSFRYWVNRENRKGFEDEVITQERIDAYINRAVRRILPIVTKALK